MIKIIKLFTLLPFLICFNPTPSSTPSPPIFIGKVTQTYQANGIQNAILVNGYIYDCAIYCSDLILTLDIDTKIMDSCSKQQYTSPLKINDNIYAELDFKMTKSIPPQVFAKIIHVYY